MLVFLVLPHDVRSVILSNLELQDILRLRQTCSKISDNISNDKQLWRRLLNDFVKARSLPLPRNIRHVDEMSARGVESCIKHALILNRNYSRADRELRTLKVGIRSNLRTTWVKLILGRWCLIASSNDDLSELSLWEIKLESELRLAAKIFLEAPVIDGQVNQRAQGIRCAVTVGSSRPYILVLSITQDSSKVSFKQLAELPDASHVRLLQGDLVGFAVRSGDDTFPFVSDLTLGRCYRLRFTHGLPDESLSPFPLEPCLAMALWKGYVFTMHRTTIRVFAMVGAPENGSPTDAKCITSFAFQNEISGGHFFHASESAIEAREGAILYVWAQDLDSGLHRATVFSYRRHGNCKDFSMVEEPFENPPHVLGPRTLNLYQLGPSQLALFCITSLKMRQWRIPRLLFASLRQAPDNNVGPQSTVLPEYVKISTRGLPLPHLISNVDFDDGRGLVLLATVNGDVRVVSLLSHEILAPESVTDLGMDTDTTSWLCPMLPKISDIPIALDLPIYYTSDRHVPLSPKLAEQAAYEWRIDTNGVQPFENWSNDWSTFERIWDWLAPSPRWGLFDPYFVERPLTGLIRDRIRILGEIIPLLYDSNSHCRVIFRVGERIFYCRLRHEMDIDDDIYDFEDTGDLHLGVLPLTYGDILSDPRSILLPASDYHIKRNLSSWWSPLHENAQSDVAYDVNFIRDYLVHILGVSIDYGTMETWTDDDWDGNYFAAAEIDPYPCSDPED